jgi:hypothetical protein
MRPVTPDDLHRLADRAIAKGIRLFEEPISGDTFATSSRHPRLLYRLTAWSCTCPGFVSHQRCMHLALLMLETGMLPDLPDPEPDPEPDPVPVAQVAVAFAEDQAAPAPAVACAVPANVVAFPDPAERAAAMTASVEASVERLAEQLAAGHTAEFAAFLAFMGRFHRYSARNCMLIRAQKPEATLVAGLSRWRELGYRVRRGEKALWILAPVLRRGTDPETGEVAEDVVGFRPATVFDASQLDGLNEKPLPSPRSALPDDMAEAYALVKAQVEARGIRVVEDWLPLNVDGVSEGGTIRVARRLSSRARLFTLLHEVAHEVAHRGADREGTTPQQRELQAEATAFAVAAALGLDCPMSRDYLLSWRITPDELRSALSTVQVLVRRVLDTVRSNEARATDLAA